MIPLQKGEEDMASAAAVALVLIGLALQIAADSLRQAE